MEFHLWIKDIREQSDSVMKSSFVPWCRCCTISWENLLTNTFGDFIVNSVEKLQPLRKCYNICFFETISKIQTETKSSPLSLWPADISGDTWFYYNSSTTVKGGVCAEAFIFKGLTEISLGPSLLWVGFSYVLYTHPSMRNMWHAPVMEIYNRIQ